jgi:hypothetical protein
VGPAGPAQGPAGEPSGDLKKKLEIVRRGTEQAFPTADIDQMLAEIEKGRLPDVMP